MKMSKQTRKQRKEEEKRIIQELESAMSDPPQLPATQKSPKSYGENMPEKLHCKRCRTLMEDGVCPLCGYRVYMPMDEKKRKKYRWILTGIFLAVFLVIVILTR